MIDATDIFSENSDVLSMWVESDVVGADLANVATTAIAKHIPILSVAPDSVGTLWPWLENTPVKIVARFYVPKLTAANATTLIADMSGDIRDVFKRGASGAQVFVRVHDLGLFVKQLHLVRDDLFFNRTLSIGIDIGDVDANAWNDVLDMINHVSPDSILFALTHDAGAKSDYVGRVYGMLMNIGDFRGQLHFATGSNVERIEQTVRLIRAMQPNFVARTQIFVNN